MGVELKPVLLDVGRYVLYYQWPPSQLIVHAVNRWLSVRFNLLSAGIVGAIALVCLITPSITASTAGFALAFASTITGDLLFMVSCVFIRTDSFVLNLVQVRRFVGLEQSMV